MSAALRFSGSVDRTPLGSSEPVPRVDEVLAGRKGLLMSNDHDYGRIGLVRTSGTSPSIQDLDDPYGEYARPAWGVPLGDDDGDASDASDEDGDGGGGKGKGKARTKDGKGGTG